MLTLAVENYRSIRDLALSLTDLNIVTGANGSGKSSLYRALRLLADASYNGAVGALAREGGLQSTLWAGPEKPGTATTLEAMSVQNRQPVGLKLGFASTDFGYAIDLGIPGGDPLESKFTLDPEIKSEVVWNGPFLRPSATLVERHNGVVTVRGTDGRWLDRPYGIRKFDSILSEFSDPEVAPELFRVRERVRAWRFYDHFRTDADAPARGSHIGTRTPVLSADGADLAAAIRTIMENGDLVGLEEAVDNAFPGSKGRVENSDGRFNLGLRQRGLIRPLGVAELSDGTLRYLLLVAALLSPRPPELLVLNEPETSLHPDLLAPLGSLIAATALQTQIIVVSHSQELITALKSSASDTGSMATSIELVKESGATVMPNQGLLDRPSWHWLKR